MSVRLVACAAIVLLVVLPLTASAQSDGEAEPTGGVEIRLTGTDVPQGWGAALNILLMMTLLTLAPAILVSVTSFTRILISLHFVRQAIGTQTAPGNQVLIGLALFLTLFVMYPVGEQIYEDSVVPLQAGSIDGPAAVSRAWPTLRDFMIPQTRSRDLALFGELAQSPITADAVDEIPARVVVPAFLISEIKTAFQIGILLYVPFLLLDLIIASILLALGMMMLPPVVISTPLKLVLFVVADGWNLLIAALVRSFH